MNHTTKRFKRTLHEAFPRDAWCAIERYRAPSTDKALGVLLATVIGALLAAVLVNWLAGG